MMLTPHCYHEPTLALRFDGVSYFASDALGVREFSGDLVLNLSGKSNLTGMSQMPEELRNHLDMPYTEIMIPFPDGGIPLVKSSFWKTVHAWIKSKGYKTVCVHCEAGHGRTGTFLSALAVANLRWTVEKSVKHLRYQICRHLVETSNQCEYLVELDQELNNRKEGAQEIPDPSFEILFREHQEESDSPSYEEMFVEDMDRDDEHNQLLRQRKEE